MNKETEIEEDDEDRLTDYVRPYEVAKHVADQLTGVTTICPTPEKVEEVRLTVYAAFRTAKILDQFLSDPVKHENGETGEEVLQLRDLIANSIAIGCTDAAKLNGRQKNALREVIRATAKAHLNNSLVEMLGGDSVDLHDEDE